MTARVDLALRNGNVITVDHAFSVHSAIAISGDRIVAVGSDSDVDSLTDDRTEVIDLEGRTVLPGIVDGHLHLSNWAVSRPPWSLRLGPHHVSSLDEVLDAVREAAASTPTGWVIGNGWTEAHIAEFADGSVRPHRLLLDRVSGEVPVLLRHRSLHAAWANSAALRASGVTAESPDPDGGTIVRDSDGTPTGELIEGAAFAVEPPPLTDEQWAEAVTAAIIELQRRGYTSVTDPKVEPDLLRRYSGLRERGGPWLRLGVLLHWTPPGPHNSLARVNDAIRFVGTANGIGDEWFRLEGVKLFADGIPPLRTAWMQSQHIRQQCCGPTDGGLVTAGADDEARLEELRQMMYSLHRARCRLGVHATGDLACDAVAEIFMEMFDDDPWPAGRHHLIHASMLSRSVAARLARYNVTISTNALIKWQATVALSQVLDDATNAYHIPFRTLVDAGLHVADGSDAPITEPDWRRALQTLVRRDVYGTDEISGPDECLPRADALRALTIEGAFQQGTERERGSLEVGKVADLIVVDRDPTTVDADQLHALGIEMTILAGSIIAR